MKKPVFTFILFSILLSCKDDKTTAEAETTIIDHIAEANGLQNFENLEELNFTFNVKVNDSLRSQRSWEWNITDGDVILTEGNEIQSYNTSKAKTAENKEIDKKFVNDKYWLLYPLVLKWDEMEYSHSQNAVAPISGEKMQQLIVSYPQDAGYTPGDEYQVFFGDDYIIREWVYTASGKEEPSLITTWQDYEEFNGVKISKSHKSPDGSFEIFFSNIETKPKE